MCQRRLAALRLLFKCHYPDPLGFRSTLWPVISSRDLLLSLISSITPHSRTAMSPPPDGVYTAFSFIGFVLCAIPFYWHLEGTWKYSHDLTTLRMYGSAWNTGTCLYMIWVGFGCLMQSINSILWNKNMIDRAPVYCDICKLFDALSLEYPLILSLHALQQPVSKPRLMLQCRSVRSASTAASTRLLP